MALRRLYNLTTNSLSGVNTGVLPGGAGVQTAGTTSNPGISAPRVEELALEVLDVTAAISVPTPAAAGKLLVQDLSVGSFGATWRLNTTRNVQIGGGQYGIVVAAGQASEAQATGTSGTSTGTKAVVILEGPVQAFVTSSALGSSTAISAGMALAGDNSGNLTYAGASPNAGAVLARAGGSMAASTSAPALMSVYVGGY